MTLEDILNRLLEIQKANPEALQQDAKYMMSTTISEFWDSEPKEGAELFRVSGDMELESIDEITKVYDSDADAEVYIFHP